ncbi:MAG: DUF1667 domain-containing protein [Clostridia bacterium]|nr:DUF1667 domain-containing protein [Clostridia bacterium]
MLNPTRTLTSTVRVQNGVKPVVSVKSAKPLPKDLLLKCMERINSVSLTAPVHIGDCILANIMETGVDIVASSRVELKD